MKDGADRQIRSDNGPEFTASSVRQRKNGDAMETPVKDEAEYLNHAFRSRIA